MSERLRRLAAIVRADLLVRFRRPSTLVIFLLLSAFAYVWVPDPATGRALMQIEGKRALYNSAAIGMATALLAAMFIGLFGFYVVSNAIRRDVQSRCGFVIASTTMRGGEYLLGKVAGNIVFLTVFTAGFMVTSMVMLLVRGEAPLEPLVFATQYLLMVPPAIVFVSVIAVLFESIPFLAGKFGDVVYFFLWLGSLGAVAANISGTEPGFLGFFDVSGFGMLKAGMKTDHIAIGTIAFDAANGVHVFEGLRVSAAWLIARVVSTVLPLLLVPVALLFFHRFNPARLRKSVKAGSRNWIALVGSLFKPFARVAYGVASLGSGSSLVSMARTDALMALTAHPLSIVAVAVFAIATPKVILPFAFAVLAVLIADIASRETRTGTLGLVYATPRLRSRFVAWKFGAAAVASLIVLAGPATRIAVTSPSSLPALLVGIAFVAASATALGIVSSNPKTFIVAFLTFWYVVMNDGGKNRALDFAGFFGVATPAVVIAYAAAAVGALLAAQAFYAMRLRRAF